MKTSRVHMFSLICLTVSLALLSTIVQAQDCGTDDMRPQAVSGSCLVWFAKDNLTVKVRDVLLHELLDEIARQSGLKVVPYVALDERVTLEFHHLSLERGLRRILRHRSFLLEYPQQPSEDRQSAVAPSATLWILPQGEESKSVQKTDIAQQNIWVPGEGRATEDSRLRAALNSGQSWQREEVIIGLAERGRTDAVPTLSLALGDENEAVREAALLALVEIGGSEAANAMSIALFHTDPKVRVEAVDALGEIGGALAMGLLEQALADDDHDVRNAAADVLEHMRSQVR